MLAIGFYFYLSDNNAVSENTKKEQFYVNQEKNNLIPQVLSPKLKEKYGDISKGQNTKPIPKGTAWLGNTYQGLVGMAGPSVTQDATMYGVLYVSQDYARRRIFGAGTPGPIPIIINTIPGNVKNTIGYYKFNYDFTEKFNFKNVQVLYDPFNNTVLVPFRGQNKTVVIATKGNKKRIIQVLNKLQFYS
jgi:hypothetical protein